MKQRITSQRAGWRRRTARWAFVTAALALCSQTALADDGNGNATTRRETAGPAPLQVVYFDTPGCSQCDRVEDTLKTAVEAWAERIELVRFNTHKAVGRYRLAQFKEHYKATLRKPPTIFVGTHVLTTPKQIIKGLDKAIRGELAAGHRTFVPPPLAATDTEPETPGSESSEEEVAAQGVADRLRKSGPWAVCGAGLLDGVNPCAFTTIVFLLSMLAYLGRSRRQMAVVGIGFTAAVFVTYMLLGLGLLWAVKTFSVDRGIATGLAVAVAALAFVFAAWSLVDFVRTARSGDARKATLGLPKSVRARINQVIRSGLKTRNLVVGAVGVGFLVAVLESVCTGQVYFPAIMIMVRTPDMRAAAVGYLVLYNVMFILPLVAVLVVAWFGVKSDALARLMQRHLAVVKLGMAVLFVGLGVLVLLTL